MSLYLKQLQLGPMQNFVYLIGDTTTRRAVAVDPAWDIDAVLNTLAADDMTLEAALITHFHPDHIGGGLMGQHIAGPVELLERGAKIKVYVHKDEADYVPRVCGLSKTDLSLCESGDELALGEHRIRFLHTPGHTPGSQCFLVDDNLVSGDTLFIGGCGRVDLPGSDPAQMYDSLVNKLKALPDDTVLYPGHDYFSAYVCSCNLEFSESGARANYKDHLEKSGHAPIGLVESKARSTIGEEKRRNRFMRSSRLEDFLGMMGY